MTARSAADRPIKALIFDMDGVLIDSEPIHLIAYQEILAGFGIQYTELDNRELLGRTEVDCARILVERYKLDVDPLKLSEDRERIYHRLLQEQSSNRGRPGVETILATGIRLNLPMGLASSANMATIQIVVDTLNIRRFFKCLTSGEEVAHGKPAPDVFLLAAERLGQKPEDCLVIEDTFNGIRAAKAAGMRCVAIPCESTRHQDHSQADLNLSSLDDLDLAQWCLAQI